MKNIQDLVNKYKDIQDERFFEDVFAKKEYEAIQDMKADVVLDVGACAGEFSAYIYERAGIIYALEPFLPHYEELISNIKDFGLTKIKPYNLALSGTNGEAKFSTDTGRGANHLASNSPSTTEIKTCTLATFIKEHSISRVDILKIDIEGDENQVFGALDFPEVAPLINCIIGEHLYAVEHILEENGFIKKVLPGNANTLYERTDA